MLNQNLSHRKSVKGAILIFTVALALLGAWNFYAQVNASVKKDGVRWVFQRGMLIADNVPEGSAGARAGLQRGDRLLSINFRQVHIPQDVGKTIRDHAIPSSPYQYEIVRGTDKVVKLVTPVPEQKQFYYYLALIGYVILGIGVFAFLKTRSRSFALHFYLLCLAFYGIYAFSSTGKLDIADWIFFWADNVFILLLPPIFLHFAIYFPGKTETMSEDKIPFLYVPSFILLAARIAITVFYYLWPQNTIIPTIEGYLSFENIELFYLLLGLFAGIVVLFFSYAKERDVIRKKQLKLVLAGLVAGFGPFSFLWLISMAIRIPEQALEAALVPQVLIPLSLTYALFKYRLMDVDIIIKRGMIYTVTTLVLFLLYLGLTISWVHWILPQATRAKTVAVATITTLLAALLFQPLRDRVRMLVDRFYYKDSYDYRRTLVQFSREITSSFDLDQLSDSILRHILSTFRSERADLLLKTGMNRFESLKDRRRGFHPSLGFLTRLSCDPFVFIDSYDSLDADFLDDEAGLRQLEANYFIPCKFKHNIVAILSLSKKDNGDYLSSEDLDLLLTLANQLAIVIENHHLFYTLKNKADELERLKNFNENILLSLNVGIVTLDDSGKIVSCNNYIESFLGLNRVVIMGQRLEQLFPPEIVDRYQNYSMKATRKKMEGTRFYKTLIEDFGAKDYVMNISFVPLINESDIEYGTILILDDVTHQAKLEEHLTQNEKLSALGLLAAGVAHEVNTPLTGISSYTQMLETQNYLNSDTKEILQKIEQQTFRASKIINTLLDLSRQQPEPFVPINLNTLLRDTLMLLKPHFKDGSIQVIQELDAPEPLVMGNEGKLQQVFTNLVLNAKDAMTSGGKLLAKTEQDGDDVLISIVDTGSGIDGKSLKRIYEPFFTTKKGLKGTGLGLAITYTIIQEHKGSIDVSSEEGKGTHFQIRLAKLKKEVHEQSRAYSGD